MTKHIKAKYGDNFIQKIDKKFRELRKKGLIDRDAIYIGKDDIKKEIISNLNKDKFINTVVTIQFIVKKNGLLKEVTVHGIAKNETLKTAVLKVFNKMKKIKLWKPALFNQKEIESFYQNIEIKL